MITDQIQDEAERGDISAMKKLFVDSRVAYENYIAGGKRFKYAKELYRINTAARMTIASNIDQFPPKLQPYVKLLLSHYDAWSSTWLKTQSQLNPNDDDAFVFSNDNTFPRVAEKKIIQYISQGIV